ncbi:MAG: hypothetical protein ACRCS6_04570 [Turicibacter sp.]
MAYQRTTSVQGTEMIEAVEVTINFSYNGVDAPTTVNFSINGEGLSVYGMCDKTNITNYTVNGGIITDEFMEKVKLKCIEALTNYDTI